MIETNTNYDSLTRLVYPNSHLKTVPGLIEGDSKKSKAGQTGTKNAQTHRGAFQLPGG